MGVTLKVAADLGTARFSFCSVGVTKAPGITGLRVRTPPEGPSEGASTVRGKTLCRLMSE
jgi:hypothetical protein